MIMTEYNINRNMFVKAIVDYIRKYNEAAKFAAETTALTREYGKKYMSKWSMYNAEKVAYEEIVKSLYNLMPEEAKKAGRGYVLEEEFIRDKCEVSNEKTVEIEYTRFHFFYDDSIERLYENRVIF